MKNRLAMRSRIYRAACWIPRGTREPVPLTGPELRDLDSRELLAEGLNLATRLGYLECEGWIEVLPYPGQETFEVHEVEALLRLSHGGGGTETELLDSDACLQMTEALAEGRARVAGELQKPDGYTHNVELTHNLDDTLLPFTVAFRARLRPPGADPGV